MHAILNNVSIRAPQIDSDCNAKACWGDVMFEHFIEILIKPRCHRELSSVSWLGYRERGSFFLERIGDGIIEMFFLAHNKGLLLNLNRVSEQTFRRFSVLSKHRLWKIQYTASSIKCSWNIDGILGSSEHKLWQAIKAHPSPQERASFCFVYSYIIKYDLKTIWFQCINILSQFFVFQTIYPFF